MGYIDINDIPMAMLDKCYLDYENLYDDTNFFFWMKNTSLKLKIPTIALIPAQWM